MNSSFFITSPIYYVNDTPHIGHAYTSIACDTMARFQRLQSNEVFFLTGTDEHGQKVEKSALTRGRNPQNFCDEVSQKFYNLSALLNLSNDDFIRTTQERHKQTVKKIWQILEQKGWIYKGIYEGWYAVRDEAFYGEDEIINGKAPTGAEVSWHKEESYFFRLSAFQGKLLALYDAVPDFIRPASKRNEIISFVKSGLHDLSISRTSFAWGIKVPSNQKDEKHVIYVWLDALVNYLSALGFADFESEKANQNSANNSLFQKFWLDAQKSPLHVIGKDILRFHGVYWPAFLMAAEISLPYGVYAHGWWTNEGQKISKSVGNVIDPLKELEWLEALGCEAETAIDYFRYFLLREVPFGNDGDYSRQHLIARVNSELANNIGNLAQRSLAMIFANCGGEIPARIEDSSKDSSLTHNLARTLIEPFIEDYFAAFDVLAFDKAINAVIEFSSLVNKKFNDSAPWNLKKEGKIEEMNQVLHYSAESLRLIAILLLPFIPTSAAKLLDILSIPKTQRSFDSINNFLVSGYKINEPKALFPRLNF